jgi:CheY-like chemotaxis protein
LSSTFFLTDLPPTITEPTLRKLLRDDLFVSVSFHDSPTGTVAMVEARAAREAERAAHELEQSTLDAGTPLTVVARQTAEGQRLALLFSPPPAEEHEQRACGKRTAYSACVLIVDDDPVCLQGMQDLLSFHLPQVCIHIANSGDLAVTLNRTRAFDAILSDVQMPGLDGLSLVANIKRIRPHTPVVLMTGSPDLMPLLIGSGAFGFLRKPVNTSYCVTALQHAIRYCALSRFVGKAKLHRQDAVQTRARLLCLAEAELGESGKQWNRV